VPAPRPPPDNTAIEANRKRVTVGVISLVVAITTSLLAFVLFLTGPRLTDGVAPFLIAITAWVCALLVQNRRDRFVPHTMITATMVAAILALISFGSVRSAGSVLFTVVVAAAGIFLGLRALLVTVGAGMLSLAALIVAERRGWLHEPHLDVDFLVWLVHATTMTVMAIMIFHSRRSLETAHEQTRQELQRRQQTEQERDRLIRRFSRMFHSSPSPMVAQSAITGILLDVNPAFERTYGYTRDQVLGRTDQFFWADQQQRTGHARRLLKERRIIQQEIDALRADASLCKVMLSSELSDEEGDRLVISTLTDVTEQTQMLDELKRSKELFFKAFNFSPLKMTITRLKDGMFLEMNRARDPVQGKDRQVLLGKTTLETGGWLSEAERQTFVERIQQEGHLSGYETRMRHINGDLIDAKIWAELIEIDGEDCVLSCFVNTTEEKRREQQLMEMARGMTGSSAEDFFVSLAVHMAKALGAETTSVAELLPGGQLATLAIWRDGAIIDNFQYPLKGTPCGEAIAQPDLCVFAEGLDQRFANRASLVKEGFKSFVGQRLQDTQGRPIGVVYAMWRRPIVLQPDTWAMMSIFASRANAELLRLRHEREIRALNGSLEQRVQERTADLHKLNAELDSFAYSVSHDLKSPLRAIDGFTRLLGEQLAERMQPDEQAMMDRILSATSRMSTLIADLLALARISQGALERQSVDLSALAHDILEQEQQRQPERVIERSIEPGMHVQCDPRLARIALENLLGNALKYSRERTPIRLDMGRLDGEHGVFIRDNGVGFDMAYADKLFKPFQRLHLPSQFEGTGIGLATVRRIMERHGGWVSGQSEPGQGAEFRFSFGACTQAPVAPDTNADAGTSSAGDAT